MAEKKDIPWDMVGVDYREGILSLDGVVEKWNRQFSRALLIRKAKHFGWVRDTTAKVSARAHEIVDAAETAGVTGGGVTAGVTAALALQERVVVEGAAQAQATIELKQRGTLAAMCETRDLMLASLREQVANPEELYPLIREAIAAHSNDGDMNAAKRVVRMANDILSLPAQIQMLKDLVDMESKIQAMQRKAYRMDIDGGGSGIEDLLEKLGR